MCTRRRASYSCWLGCTAHVHTQASILFISDSVDRHIMTYLCERAGGKIKAAVLGSMLRAELNITDKGPIHPSVIGASNISGYAVNLCKSNSGMLLASTYFPGVHPTGGCCWLGRFIWDLVFGGWGNRWACTRQATDQRVFLGGCRFMKRVGLLGFAAGRLVLFHVS